VGRGRAVRAGGSAAPVHPPGRATDGAQWLLAHLPFYVQWYRFNMFWRYGDGLRWRLVLIGLTEDASQYVARGYTPLRGALGL